ncbi:MAG: flavin reductase family protein [Pseudomonadota bacterium]
MNMQTRDTTTFAPRELRDVLGRFATGVAVVTTCGEASLPVGMTINSFASVSLDPPEVLWSIARSAPSRKDFFTYGAFAVNVMSDADKESTIQFARPSDDKFSGIAWRPGLRGIPVLDAAIATLECETKQIIPCGDHDIIVGSVRAIDGRDGQPLVFFRGEFLSLGQTI